MNPLPPSSTDRRRRDLGGQLSKQSAGEARAGAGQAHFHSGLSPEQALQSRPRSKAQAPPTLMPKVALAVSTPRHHQVLSTVELSDQSLPRGPETPLPSTGFRHSWGPQPGGSSPFMSCTFLSTDLHMALLERLSLFAFLCFCLVSSSFKIHFKFRLLR